MEQGNVLEHRRIQVVAFGRFGTLLPITTSGWGPSPLGDGVFTVTVM